MVGQAHCNGNVYKQEHIITLPVVPLGPLCDTGVDPEHNIIPHLGPLCDTV